MTTSCHQDRNIPIDKQSSSTKYTLVKYTDTKQDIWDTLVTNSVNGTLLHTRKFLSYHDDKFVDQSLMAYDETGVLRAVFPAATDPQDKTIVVSHPGITYGGIVHDGWLRGQRCIDLLSQLCSYYAAAAFNELIYKAVPWIYHRTPAQDDIYALSRLQAERYRVDLSTTIDLQNRGTPSDRRKRLLKKAHGSGIEISDDFAHLDAYWSILAQNLKSKHNKTPVHSIQDLHLLKTKFPQEIELVTAIADKEIYAGALIFHCPTLLHGQYFASSPTGRTTGALDLVIEHCLDKTMHLGKRCFDFGISTEEQGKYLNDNLHTFKCEFGSGGTVYEFYKLKF